MSRCHPTLSILPYIHCMRSALTKRRFSVLLILALCSVGLPAATSTSSPAILADGGFPAKTYFRATRLDPRLCPSPVCGGVFVEKLNRAKLRCDADGVRARECQAHFLDWSALALDPEEEARVEAEFIAKRVVVRGKLVSEDSTFGVPLTTLVVSDAWRGVTGNKPSWRFFGVVPSGIVCITFPCPIYQQIGLNTLNRRLLEGLDLSESGASDEQIEMGFEALQTDGLIVAGKHREISGPAGKGRELVAKEFYTKVREGVRACGGYTYPPNPACESKEFCEPPPGSCLIADLPGVCVSAPDACPLVIDPVCGCDGRTYNNDCERQMAEVGLDHVGACSDGGSCGLVSCADGTVCCNPVMGICTPPGWVCIQ